MSKNKPYIVFSTDDGRALASFDSPLPPILQEGQSYIEGVCNDISECWIDLETLEIK